MNTKIKIIGLACVVCCGFLCNAPQGASMQKHIKDRLADEKEKAIASYDPTNEYLQKITQEEIHKDIIEMLGAKNLSINILNDFINISPEEFLSAMDSILGDFSLDSNDREEILSRYSIALSLPLNTAIDRLHHIPSLGRLIITMYDMQDRDSFLLDQIIQIAKILKETGRAADLKKVKDYIGEKLAAAPRHRDIILELLSA